MAEQPLSEFSEKETRIGLKEKPLTTWHVVGIGALVGVGFIFLLFFYFYYTFLMQKFSFLSKNALSEALKMVILNGWLPPLLGIAGAMIGKKKNNRFAVLLGAILGDILGMGVIFCATSCFWCM